MSVMILDQCIHKNIDHYRLYNVVVQTLLGSFSPGKILSHTDSATYNAQCLTLRFQARGPKRSFDKN